MRKQPRKALAPRPPSPPRPTEPSSFARGWTWLHSQGSLPCLRSGFEASLSCHRSAKQCKSSRTPAAAALAAQSLAIATPGLPWPRGLSRSLRAPLRGWQKARRKASPRPHPGNPGGRTVTFYSDPMSWSAGEAPARPSPGCLLFPAPVAKKAILVQQHNNGKRVCVFVCLRVNKQNRNRSRRRLLSAKLFPNCRAAKGKERKAGETPPKSPLPFFYLSREKFKEGRGEFPDGGGG